MLQAIWAKIAALFEKSTYVRHTLIPTIAIAIEVAISPLLDQLTTAADQKTVYGIVLIALCGLVRLVLIRIKAALTTPGTIER